MIGTHRRKKNNIISDSVRSYIIKTLKEAVHSFAIHWVAHSPTQRGGVPEHLEHFLYVERAAECCSSNGIVVLVWIFLLLGIFFADHAALARLLTLMAARSVEDASAKAVDLVAPWDVLLNVCNDECKHP